MAYRSLTVGVDDFKVQCGMIHEGAMRCSTIFFTEIPMLALSARLHVVLRETMLELRLVLVLRDI